MFRPYSKEDQLRKSQELNPEDMKQYQDRTMTWMKEKARSLCHEYVRERDREGNTFTCISCGKKKLIKKEKGKSNYHAGHFKNAYEFPNLKFDEVNVNGQCDQCNYFKSGNLAEYAENLIKKWGRDQYDRLMMIAALDKRSRKKWTKIEYVEVIKYYSRKLKELRDARSINNTEGQGT